MVGIEGNLILLSMGKADRWALTCLVVGIQGPVLCSACSLVDCWIIRNLMNLLNMGFWNFLCECGLFFLLDLLVLIFKFQTTRLVGLVFSSFSSFYSERTIKYMHRYLQDHPQKRLRKRAFYIKETNYWRHVDHRYVVGWKELQLEILY